MAVNVTSANQRQVSEYAKEPEEPIKVFGDVEKMDESRNLPMNIPKIAEEVAESAKEKTRKRWFNFQTKLLWFNIIFIILFHLMSIYAVLTFSLFENLLTTFWGFFMGQVSGFGVTGGAHRLWTHRSYKAKWPLRAILAVCYLTAGQNKIYDWVRDHRIHHKYSETDADPHNSNRGFFFAHVGWLMMKKHPEVIRRGRQMDMSDILADPIVTFSDKYFLPLKLLFCFVLPTIVPVYCWNETWSRSIASQILLRYVISLNSTWSVNSAAHIWGNKPYSKNISPAENRAVAVMAMGEGWHNYHHVFPFDYKAAELGDYSGNTTTMLIDMFAKIGWAYDLKQPSKDLVRRIALKSGDGSWKSYGSNDELELDVRELIG